MPLAGDQPGSLVLDELGAVVELLDAGPGSLVLDELGKAQPVPAPVDAGAAVVLPPPPVVLPLEVGKP
jgi:hypothetical protein